MKFLRDYELNIQVPAPMSDETKQIIQNAGIQMPTQSDLITIKPPFTMISDIDRNTLASANKGNFTIYNLSPDIRNKIYKDRYNTVQQWQIELKCGYDQVQTIFKGYIYEAYSYKQGTEWITYIDAFDGLYDIQNSFTSKTVQSNTNKEQIINKVISDMPNIIAGTLGSPAQGNGTDRGSVLFGKSDDVLKMVSGNQYFIDMGLVHVMANGEYFGNKIIMLDSEQLLTTPRRRETLIDVDVLLIPEAQLGVLFEINSKEKIYNGQYVCYGVKHHFEWNGASCGDSKSTISLYFGAGGLKKVS